MIAFYLSEKYPPKCHSYARVRIIANSIVLPLDLDKYFKPFREKYF